ncbi:MAG: HigA family addiction module antitoxin [Parachlamydiales bacterium]
MAIHKKISRRKPSHPGIILDEHYIKPLNLNLQKLADHLGIARNTLFKIRSGHANVTPAIALSLAKAFDTSPELWLNLQQKYDLWVEENIKPHEKIMPIIKNGILLSMPLRTGLVKRPGSPAVR